MTKTPLQKALDEGVKAGLGDMSDAICKRAEDLVPVDTGTLQASISTQKNEGSQVPIIETKRKSNGKGQYTDVENVVGYSQVPSNDVEVTGEDFEKEFGAYAPHAADVEYGTRPHIIVPNKAKALRFKQGDKEVFRQKVNHPGTLPQPFMRPAMDEYTGKKGLELIGKAIMKSMKKVKPPLEDE